MLRQYPSKLLQLRNVNETPNAQHAMVNVTVSTHSSLELRLSLCASGKFS